MNYIEEWRCFRVTKKKKRLLKPITVMKKWDALVLKAKPKSPGKVAARHTAALAGMKSIGEVRCAADMDKRKIPWKYEHEKLAYQHKVQAYIPDFTLVDNDDLLIEYKGKMTDETRKKIASIKRCNPERRICLVFERPNNKLSSRAKMRYWEWAERKGIEWSDKYVLEEWL
jgi:predicted nuclease of restriction endonuclease-like RecB superfamily